MAERLSKSFKRLFNRRPRSSVSEGEPGEESRVGASSGWESREEADVCGPRKGEYRKKPEPPSWSRLTEPCTVHLRGVSEGESGEESRVGASSGWESLEESDVCGPRRGDYRIKPEPPSWSHLTEPCTVHLRGEDIVRFRYQLSSYDDPTLRRIYEYYRDDLIHILENMDPHAVLVELKSQNVLNTEKYQPMEKDPSSFSHTLLQDIRNRGRKAVIGLWECLYALKKDHPHPNLLSVLDEITQTGEKRLGTSEVTRDPQPPKEGEIPKPQPQDVEEGEVYEVAQLVTGDVDVVEEESHFTSAQVLIREIMVCNWDLQKIKEDINDVEKRLKNLIDVFGRIENTPTFLKLFLFF